MARQIYITQQLMVMCMSHGIALMSVKREHGGSSVVRHGTLRYLK
jgi:hypothetical protein